jgi:PEP-CTERM motif
MCTTKKLATCKSGLVLSLFAVAASIMPLVARATTVTNITTGTVVFSADYEGAAASLQPAPDDSGSYNPGVPAIGNWIYVAEDSLHDIQVTSSTFSPDPGPTEGSQYLRIWRDPSFPGNAADGALSVDQTTSGDLIRLSQMFNSTADVGAQIGLVGTNSEPTFYNTAVAWVRPRTASGGFWEAVGPGFALTNTGLPYTPGWHEVDIDYVVGASTFSLTVDGATVSGLPSYAPGVVKGFHYGVGSQNATAYFDAVPVPEPATFALLATGLVGFVCCGRRKWK